MVEMQNITCLQSISPAQPIRPTHVIIIGASGHARVIADIVRCCGDIVEGFLDDKDAEEFSGMNILGKVADVEIIHRKDISIRFIIGIGINEIRARIAEKHHYLPYYTATHPSAVIAKDCIVGHGSVVMANAVINTGSRIGYHCIINTAATADHDCLIHDYVHLSPGVHLSGTVEIGKGTWLGTGAVVINNVSICGGCIVGAGAVVTSDINNAGTYIGVPAILSHE